MDFSNNLYANTFAYASLQVGILKNTYNMKTQNVKSLNSSQSTFENDRPIAQFIKSRQKKYCILHNRSIELKEISYHVFALFRRRIRFDNAIRMKQTNKRKISLEVKNWTLIDNCTITYYYFNNFIVISSTEIGSKSIIQQNPPNYHSGARMCKKCDGFSLQITAQCN